MCTAAVYKTRDSYFGRNLDYEFAYNQTVTITPRNYRFDFRKEKTLSTHYAMIGMAFVRDNYPLYYDAINEKGLGMAGLNFPENAVYHEFSPACENITPFELIPWALGRCASIAELRPLLSKLSIYREDFSADLPLSPLHWVAADERECIVIESMADGLHVYDNPARVLTNNPPFDYHLTNLCNYMSLSPADPENRFSKKLSLSPYSRGMGGLGLPGDLSSASRFIKAAFTLHNSRSGESEQESVAQFFHILGSVAQQKGCCKVQNGYEYTIYSSCCNQSRGIYYYTTYENSRPIGVDMHREDLEGSALVSYPLIEKSQIFMQN